MTEAMRPIFYDWASFTLTNGQSDYDVKSNVAALFSNVPLAKNISIKFDKAISMKINLTLMPAITLPIGDSPFQSPERFLDIKNIYLSNSSGSSASIQIFLW